VYAHPHGPVTRRAHHDRPVAVLADRQNLDLVLGATVERRLFERCGWRVRRSQEVARTPEMCRGHIQLSRGEFSADKPSCMQFQNAWFSDRTLCYLASGRPAAVEDTGPSAFLPNGEGLFRFTTVAQAAALEAVNADYERHTRAARALAEEWFDGTRTMRELLQATLDGGSSPSGELARRGGWRYR
jgi:hypothetical protein